MNPWGKLSKALKESEFLHGSTRNFDKFVKNPQTNKYDNAVGGVFLTKNPDVAKTFATENRGVLSLDSIESMRANKDIIGNIYDDEMKLISPKIDDLSEKEFEYIKDYGLIYRKGNEPIIYRVDASGNILDINDPKSILDIKFDKKSRQDKFLHEIAGDYSNDPSGFKTQMGANYTTPSNAIGFSEKAKEMGYDIIKMPDAPMSGGQSYYHMNPDKIKILSKYMPAAAAIPQLENPLEMIGKAYDEYDKAKNKVAKEIVKRTDFSKMNEKEIENTANILGIAADPLNLVEGPIGLGILGIGLMSK